MSLIIAFHANDILEAHIVCGMLQANGLQAWVSGHYLQGAVGELPPMGFAKVLVLQEELPQAQQILEEYRPGSTESVKQGEYADHRSGDILVT